MIAQAAVETGWGIKSLSIKKTAENVTICLVSKQTTLGWRKSDIDTFGIRLQRARKHSVVPEVMASFTHSHGWITLDFILYIPSQIRDTEQAYCKN